MASIHSFWAELDKKTKEMLKLIEEDADSFAQRAEMYYKKRPELISLIGDFYRAHRSLAERYDQVKSDPRTRLVTTLGSPFSSMKYRSEKTINVTEKTYDSCSETFDSEDYAESEVEDPEHEVEPEEEVEDPEPEDKYELDIVIKGDVDKEDGPLLDKEVTEKVSSEVEVCDDEVMKLKEEVEKLKEENNIQKVQLMQKDEEKREVIRQLSLAVQVLKDENMELKKSVVNESSRKWSPVEFGKLKGGLWGMLFNGSQKSRASIVALWF
ncbi:protein NETWORKED 3A-like isoform X2 [Durio zibethinus]|uniref:Protein NETWORKED 3A-like isoform X2 n=1 Tax=Durio zibethinus TaxID=66656 RepID=A0A6P6B1I0_DURZI|nr:protein NETWORKED 3A-like isoform X2 [Durio zibethinus]